MGRQWEQVYRGADYLSAQALRQSDARVSFVFVVFPVMYKYSSFLHRLSLVLEHGFIADFSIASVISISVSVIPSQYHSNNVTRSVTP